MPNPLVGMIGASVGSAAVGAVGASRAAKAQTNAANAQINEQRETRDIIRADLQPFRDAGGNALAAYQFELGLGPRPDEYGGFDATPGYDFRLDQGMQALQGTAAARGGLNSGRTMQDAMRFGQGMASQEYGNFMNRLAGFTDMGMGAANMQGNASQNAAAGIGNAFANVGNAQAAGAIGVGNAFSGGINNALGLYQYQQNLSGQQRPNSTPGFGVW